MNTRTKIIATVGVIWLAAIVVVVFQTLNTDATRNVPDERVGACVDLEVARSIDRMDDAGTNNETNRIAASVIAKGRCLDRFPGEDVPSYDVAGAAIRMGAVSLAAAVLIGGALIWTRPKGADHRAVAVDVDVESTGAARPAATQKEGASSDGVRVEESLRRLKALHDEGILTDAEYETKRQALADQL